MYFQTLCCDRTAATTRFRPAAQRGRLPETDGAKSLTIRSGGPLPRRHSPDGATPAHIRYTGLLLIYQQRKDERLSWPNVTNKPVR